MVIKSKKTDFLQTYLKKLVLAAPLPDYITNLMLIIALKTAILIKITTFHYNRVNSSLILSFLQINLSL